MQQRGGRRSCSNAAMNALSQMRGDETDSSEQTTPPHPSRCSRSTPVHRPVLQEWTACLGHASIAAAVGAAEKGFSAWKALAEEALAKGRMAARSSTGGGEGAGKGADGADGSPGLRDAAARDLAECCEVRGGNGLISEGADGRSKRLMRGMNRSDSCFSGLDALRRCVHPRRVHRLRAWVWQFFSALDLPRERRLQWPES